LAIELLVSLAIFSLLLVVIVSFLFWLNYSNSKTKSDRDAEQNARRALDEITYEIKSAKSIYTPTTTASQLSLETTRYLPADETDTFIDFFVCGTAVCLKKESQAPVAITADSVSVGSLTFTRIMNGSSPSIKVDLVINVTDPTSAAASSSLDLTSTAAVRSY